MTNTTTYEFTAYGEQTLLDAGSDNGSGINCGDSFKLPDSATVCIEVTDNDIYLSGDNYHNENANDQSYQTAEITDTDGNELGNGGQVYAEKYWWVKDDGGNWYIMVEIEQEGSGDDYFTFYTGGGYEVPEPGTHLTVHSSCNVKGDWLDYKCLDGGMKFEPDPDGKITIEAEDLELSGYKVEHQDAASGNELIKLKANTGYAKLPEFGGESCVYDIEITVIDENDGEGFLDVFVDGEFVGCFRLDENNNGNGVKDVSFSTLKLKGVEIPEGAEITFKGRKDDGEYIRIDKIEFCKVEFEECDDPNAVKIDFEGFAAGDILGDLGNGVSIEATGGSGDAMVFDSQNPTGGDGDLETQVAQLGNVLIVSEDGDSSDPDDAIGGTLTFTFDNPSTVFDLKVIDTEEGGTITVTLADGSTETFDIPNLANGGVGQVLMNVENVVEMEVALNGSGAIDDLCFVPGEPALGSLSGRYFCDENRDDLDNDGPDNGIQFVLVELLDANGNGLGVFTETDADGNYQFIDLVPGTYGVQFTDQVSGKTLVAPNANGNANDDIDSDAIADTDPFSGISTITDIVVVAGQDTPDNDAGVEEIPGALSGTYFCDDDGDGVDDGATSGDADVTGMTVMLFEADGVTPATDIDGNPVAAVQTDSQGNYRFDNLAAGQYVVMFETPAVGNNAEGKAFIAPNVGDNGTTDAVDDSDVIDAANGKTAPVTVVAGQETKDVDAGVEKVNNDPDPQDDSAEVCYDDVAMIDVLANDSDADADTLNIVEITGAGADGVLGTADDVSVAITANGAAIDLGTLESGAETGVLVSLVDDGSGPIFKVDGEAAYSDLLINETAMDQFSYTITDGNGGSGSADVDVTFKGGTDTVEKVVDSLSGLLGSEICFQVQDNQDPPLTSATAEDAYTLLLSGTGDSRFDGITFEAAYCLAINEDLLAADANTPIDQAPVLKGDIYLADANAIPAGALTGTGFGPNFSSVDAVENLDLVNWILNQDFTSIDNGDGTSSNYTDAEIQGAIWGLMDSSITVQSPLGGTQANAFEIMQFALEDANRDGIEDGGADGFEVGVDNGIFTENNNIVGLFIDPTDEAEAAGHSQPFIIGVDLFEECVCP